ncbi:MAG: hypothetical protein ACXV74_07970 [Methylobacter sp.]
MLLHYSTTRHSWRYAMSALTSMEEGNADIAWSNRAHPIHVDYVGKMRKMRSHPGRLYNQA